MRRLVPLALAGLLALAGCSSAGPRTEPSQPVGSPVSIPFTNLASAAKESVALIAALNGDLHRAAKGVTTDPTSPTTLLRKAPEGFFFGDSSLTRTGWWTLPLSYGDAVWYLHQHPPTGTRADEGEGLGGTMQTGTGAAYDAHLFLASSPTYVAEMPVFFQKVDADHTAVRADTYVALRGTRTPGSYVRQRVTSVGVSLHVTWYPGGGTRHAHGRFTIDQPGRIDRVVRDLNGLRGQVLDDAACVGGPGPIEDIVLRLHASAGVVTARLHAAYTCQQLQATVFRNGVAQDGALDAKRMTTLVNPWVNKVEEAKE